MKETISPQVENGHIDIANEVAEALMKTNLSAYQSRILWAIWRKTYGWHKKEDWISHRQLIEMTCIKKGHVSRTLEELKMRNIVTNSGNKLAFNKNYTQWKELPYGVRGYQVTPSGKKVTPSGGYKRNYTNEITTSCSDSKKNESKRKLSFSKWDMMLAKTLNKLLNENNPKRKPTTEKELKTWANECRLMRESDGRTPKEIYDHIKFSQSDPFWKQNILSISKLRKQFDILTLRMNKNNGKQYNNDPEPY